MQVDGAIFILFHIDRIHISGISGNGNARMGTVHRQLSCFHIINNICVFAISHTNLETDFFGACFRFECGHDFIRSAFEAVQQRVVSTNFFAVGCAFITQILVSVDWCLGQYIMVA